MTRLFILFLMFYGTIAFSDPIKNVNIATVPKAGTHLLFKILQLTGIYSPDLSMAQIKHHLDHYTNKNALTQSQAQNYTYLLQFFSPTQKFIIMTRDPRDCFVSMVFWIEKQGNELGHFSYKNHFKHFLDWNAQSFDKKLMQAICLDYPSNFETICRWGWFVNNLFIGDTLKKHGQGDSRFLFIRFEDLIGPGGGGSLEMQQQSLKKIIRFCGLNPNSFDLNDLAKRMWGGTSSYIEGRNKIGKWQHYFNQSHIIEFNSRYYNLISEI